MPSLFSVAVAFTAITAFFIYLLRHSPRRPYPSRAWAGVYFTVLVLLPTLWYGAYRESRALGELSQLVPPYPARIRAVWVPDVGVRDSARQWVLITRAAPEKVLAYYRDPAPEGWTVREASARSLLLSRGAARLFIAVTDGWQGTTIVYRASP